jgi:hypothetical protein
MKTLGILFCMRQFLNAGHAIIHPKNAFLGAVTPSPKL